MVTSGGTLELSRIALADLDFIVGVECDADLWFFEEHTPSDEQAVREKYLNRIKEGTDASNHDFIVSLRTDKGQTPIGLAQIWSYIEYR